MKFVLASANVKKIKEMRAILSEFGHEVISASEAGFSDDVPETGSTFEENAEIKARTVMEKTGLASIADDSGICVDALGGAPGVYSARYGGAGNDRDRTLLLLKNMEGKEQRGAKFVSSIVCVFPDGKKITASGECAGEVTEEPRGDGGFGYDPVFLLYERGVTMAELSEAEKNKISHRAKALSEFSKKLREYKDANQ